MRFKFVFFIAFLSVNSYAGIFDKIGDALKDLGDEAGEAIYEDIVKPVGDVYTTVWNAIRDYGYGDENEGVGDDNLSEGMTDFYLDYMNNAELNLSLIEGEGVPFSWVPVGVDNIIFIPVYGSNIPKAPTPSQVWNNLDSDEDGIFDDVELMLVEKFPNNNQLRLAGYRYASSIKQLIDHYDSKGDEYKTALVNLGRSESCMNLYGKEVDSAIIKINVMTNISRANVILKNSYLLGDLYLNLDRLNFLACDS